MAEFYEAANRNFSPYRGFENAYPDGSAEIARLVGPSVSDTLGGGVVRYRRVKTVWRLPFDEIVYVISGALTVSAGGRCWRASAGDVLFFAQGEPVTYDVEEEAVVFYAKYPGAAST
ncbi:MAG: cupin domain-containing protein [Elsteraceae bacterium]